MNRHVCHWYSVSLNAKSVHRFYLPQLYEALLILKRTITAHKNVLWFLNDGCYRVDYLGQDIIISGENWTVFYAPVTDHMKIFSRQFQFKQTNSQLLNKLSESNVLFLTWKLIWFVDYVVIRGYVPQGAGFYTRYYVYVIQWQRALVVYMLLGQIDSWLCYLSDVSTTSDAAGRSRRPEKRYNYLDSN